MTIDIGKSLDAFSLAAKVPVLGALAQAISHNHDGGALIAVIHIGLALIDFLKINFGLGFGCFAPLAWPAAAGDFYRVREFGLGIRQFVKRVFVGIHYHRAL